MYSSNTDFWQWWNNSSIKIYINSAVITNTMHHCASAANYFLLQIIQNIAHTSENKPIHSHVVSSYFHHQTVWLYTFHWCGLFSLVTFHTICYRNSENQSLMFSIIFGFSCLELYFTRISLYSFPVSHADVSLYLLSIFSDYRFDLKMEAAVVCRTADNLTTNSYWQCCRHYWQHTTDSTLQFLLLGPVFLPMFPVSVPR
jgi:hypothetical protein